MRKRCLQKTYHAYHRYFEKGICKRWDKFENFLADLGVRPEGKTLDRIDNSKGYSPKNCRWATWYEQENNRSDSIRLTLGKKTMTINEWAKKLNISHQTLRTRHKKKWGVEHILSATKFHRWNGPPMFGGKE